MSANFRQIHTRIWKDEWFLDLQPDEKLLFVYLFSNENTSLSGMYKLSFKVICFETGIEDGRAKEIMAKFSQDGKVFYADNIVWIVNMRKYHASNSIKVIKRIEKDLELIPHCDLKIRYIYHNDMVSKQVGLNENEDENEDENKNNNNDNVYSRYQNEIGMLSPGIVDLLDDAVSEYGEEWVSEAIQEAAKNNVRKWAYIDAILKNWHTNGRAKKSTKQSQSVGGELIE